MEILTLGHSQRPIEEVADLLQASRAAFLVDVRRFPGEKRNPGFGKEQMERLCLDLKVTYMSLGAKLGGARPEGYREYTEQQSFRDGLAELVELARKKRTVVFCRECLYFRCCRKYLADELVRSGWNVVHLLDRERSLKHRIGSYRPSPRPDESE